MKIHPAMPVVLAVLSFMHGIQSVCVMVCVLMLHEAAHALCARALGAQIEQIEWMPFGGAVRLEGFSALAGWRGAVIASAGPLVNLMTVIVCAACVQYGLCSAGELRELVNCSAALMLVNLLPVLPMDGGRIVCAILSYVVKESICRRFLSVMGGILSLTLNGMGVFYAWRYGRVNLTLFLMGSYLLYAAVNEYRVPWYRQLEDVMKAMQRITHHGEIVTLHELAAGDATPVFRLAAKLSPAQMHRIQICDASGRMIGTIEEADVVRAMLHNPAQSLKEVLEAKPKT